MSFRDVFLIVIPIYIALTRLASVQILIAKIESPQDNMQGSDITYLTVIEMLKTNYALVRPLMF